MSRHLVPCGGCDRHVRADDERCPFCGAVVDPHRPVPGRPTKRLSRAATFAFGAALTAAGAAGCADSHDPDGDAGAEVDAGETPVDAGETPVDAGEEPLDAGVAPPYGLPPDDGGGAPLYGGAPGD